MDKIPAGYYPGPDQSRGNPLISKSGDMPRPGRKAHRKSSNSTTQELNTPVYQASYVAHPCPSGIQGANRWGSLSSGGASSSTSSTPLRASRAVSGASSTPSSCKDPRGGGKTTTRKMPTLREKKRRKNLFRLRVSQAHTSNRATCTKPTW